MQPSHSRTINQESADASGKLAIGEDEHQVKFARDLTVHKRSP